MSNAIAPTQGKNQPVTEERCPQVYLLRGYYTAEMLRPALWHLGMQIQPLAPEPKTGDTTA
jgi:hypothetical protein